VNKKNLQVLNFRFSCEVGANNMAQNGTTQFFTQIIPYLMDNSNIYEYSSFVANSTHLSIILLKQLTMKGPD
jgi:hypothetical protein